MKSLPIDARGYRQTPEFTETTIPAGLLRRHATRPGVWGRIHLLEGALRYRILEPVLEEVELRPGLDGVVEPEVPHEVEPIGRVRFYVEFSRISDSETPSK